MPAKLRLGLAFLMLLAITSAVRADDKPPTDFCVGAAKVDVTPDYPIRLNGFGGRREESEGVSQRIYARALAICPVGHKPLVVIAIDNLGVRMSLVDEVFERLKPLYDIPRENIALTFTHSHCTPKVNGASDNIFSQPIPPAHQEHIDQYTAELPAKIEQAVRDAIGNARPATLEWGVGTVGFAMNRRTAGGPVDHDLPVLVIRDLDEEILAIYTSYACHCVTLSFNQISGDWAGYAAEMIERAVPGATALVSIGCGSDANPSSGVTGGKVELAEAQGAEIATEVSRLLKTDLQKITGAPSATLDRIRLPLNDPPTKEQLAAIAAGGGSAGYNAQTQLDRLERGEALLTAIDYPVQTFSFGEDLSMVFLAGEVCVDYSLRLKRELDAGRIWINAYSNDFCSYIPSERLVREGGYGGGAEIPYFALPTTLKPGLEQLIIDEVKRQVPDALAVPEGTQGVPPKSPSASLQCMTTHAGLRIELVAAEPLVVDPVAIDFGPDGRLWVAEMNDYGHGVYESFEQTGRVRWLRDNDGDGRFDEARTFVDGLRFPTDVKVQPNGILICDAPDILFAVDRDGDGQADSVEKLFTGFEVRNAQARVNSLRLGLDNWLYGSGGLFGGNVTSTSTQQTVDVSGRDFRFDPSSGVLEPATGRSQQGRCRNDWGDWFGCTNGTLITHYPIEDRYHRRNPLIAPPPAEVGVATGPNASQLIPAGELVRFELSGTPGRPTSACGIDIYRDVRLGEEYYGNAFTCEPVHQLVHRLVLEPNGVTFTGRRAETEAEREFLASTDRWFRPVQVRTGPEGALWVVDMYRYVIEHPRWIPQQTLAELDVFAGRGRGRIYRILPAIETRQPRTWPRLDKLTDAQLAGQLDSPNGTVRDLAQQMLVAEERAGAVPTLRQLVRSANRPQGQLHALCTLDGLKQLASYDLLHALRSQRNEVVRRAIRLCEGRLDDPNLLRAVLELAGHSDLRVRWQVAYTLGESDHPDAARKLAELADSEPEDAYVQAAVFSSLHRGNAAAVLKAYQQLPADERHDKIAQVLISLAIQLGDIEAFAQGIDGVLDDSAAGRTEAARYRGLARVLEAADRRQESLAGDLDAATTERVRTSYLDAINALGKPDVSDELRDALLSFVGRPMRNTSGQILGPVVSNRPTGLQRIANLISVQQSPGTQQAAIAALSRAGDAPAALLLGRWSHIGPASRSEILAALLEREAWTKDLLAALQAGAIKPAQLDAVQRQRLLRHPNADIRKLAEQILQGSNSPSREAVLAEYRPALGNAADVQHGREVFRKSCAGCHRLEDHGFVVGPDLTALTNRDAEAMLVTILDPNREVDARYIGWTAIDTQGRSATGIIVEETSAALLLREANGKEHTILRADLEELISSERSIMPEGLERDLTPQDIADVIAYVAGFDSPPKQFSGNQPRVIAANADGEFHLTASAAEIRGDQIVFEPPFQNIGYWHGQRDRATWKLNVTAAGAFDVYLDWACADASAGNAFRIEGLGVVVRDIVVATGGWDRYQQRKIATVELAAGARAVTVRPDGPLQNALFDLREIRLAPRGNSTHFAATVSEAPLPRYAGDIAPFLLDESQSTERRQLAIDQRPGMGPAIVSLLATGISGDSDEEYRRIPWIWRVAIAVGKRNDGGELRDLLDASLPRGDEPLRDWQAVVIGGGIINGLTQIGHWPTERLEEILGGVPDSKQRWPRALKLAAAMADDENIRSGTRYDALRMIALAGWDERGQHLVQFLAPGTSDELQMGAVSALGDIPSAEVSKPLIEALPRLSERNCKLAVEALLRTEQRSLALLEAIRSGQVAADLVEPNALRNHPSSRVQALAEEVLRAD